MKGFRLGITGLLLTAAFCCNAQDLVRWTDGPLTWERFMRVDSTQTDPYWVSYTLAKENKQVKSGGILYKYQDVSAAIDIQQSWVKTGEDTDANLQKIQHEFDLLQYFAEQCRTDYLFYKDTEFNYYENYFGIDTKRRLPETLYIERYRAALASDQKDGTSADYPVSREPFDITSVPCQIEKGSSDALISLLGVFPSGYVATQFNPAYGFVTGYGYREGGNFYAAQLGIGLAGEKIVGYLTEARLPIIVEGAYIGALLRYGRRVLPIRTGGLYLSAGVGYSCWKYGHLAGETISGGLTLTQGLDCIVPVRTTMNFIAKTPQRREMALHFRLAVDEMYDAARKKLMPTISLSAGLDFGFRNITKSLPQK